MKLDDHPEAVRIMTLELKVISIGKRPDEDGSHWTPPDLQMGRVDRPPIYFQGTSA